MIQEVIFMSDIFKSPLPEHTKLNYEECFVKILLENTFPERYQNLILSDKPDLVEKGNSIGIEVTSAIPKHRQEAFNLWRTMPYQSIEQQDKRKNRMKQLGSEYQGGIQIWPILDETDTKEEIDELFTCIERKIKKLNKGHYSVLQQYDLFIISELWLDNNDYTMILQKLTNKNSLKFGFTRIYLLTLNNLCVFCLQDKNYFTTEISSQKSNEWAELGRRLVEEAEETNDRETN